MDNSDEFIILKKEYNSEELLKKEIIDKNNKIKILEQKLIDEKKINEKLLEQIIKLNKYINESNKK